MTQAIPFIEPGMALSALTELRPVAWAATAAADGANAVAAGGPGTVGGADFGKLVSDGLQGVQSDWTQAQSSMRALAEGQPVNLHQVMMKMEESRLSFQLFLQVRNRLLESYQDVMRMQV
jgi:flagellar hook-basal body complex protein FliE